jgi:hypothetical protein
MKAWLTVLCACVFSFESTQAETKRIHVFVALADNEHQGISKVPPKIGNGDDAANNLYWGTTDGFKSVFGRSKAWKLEKTEENPTPQILERRSYRHTSKDCVLVAEAWRGKNIHPCLAAFFANLRNRQSDLSAFIGHNGLMDGPLTVSPLDTASSTDAIVLCCRSAGWFKSYLEALKARPVLTTEQFMYPGSFLLRDSLDVWLRDGPRSDIRMAAARAYAANQNISVKAAEGVFTKLE